MQLSFLMLIFSRKEYQSFRMFQLSRQIDKNKESRDLILELAESLTSIVRKFPYNEQIFSYLKHLQHLGFQPSHYQVSCSNILLNPQCYHPMQVFCERVSAVLRQAYKQLKIDVLLFIRRELSLTSRLQCGLILCDLFPDDCQYPIDYAKMLLYAKRTSESMTLLNQKIQYFENCKQFIKANKLKQLRFVLQALSTNPINPNNKYSADLFDRKKIYIQFLQIYADTSEYAFLPAVSAHFAKLNPKSNDILAYVFLSRIIQDRKVIQPEQYHQFRRSITPEIKFYNFSRFVGLFQVGLFDQAEAYLVKEMDIRKSGDLYTKAEYFYFIIGKYQLCLDYTFRYNMYVEKPISCNPIMALCYLKLNKPDKAKPIIQAAYDSMETSYYSMDDRKTMNLLLVFNHIGQPFKVIDLGWKLIYGWRNLLTIEVIKIKILILINYQKVRLPIRDFVRAIADECSNQRVRFTFLTHQFSVFNFMSQFCYDSQDQQIFKFRQIFVGKVWSVIRQMEKYSKEGASRMTERFVNRQPINIQSEFLH